jgi:putative spermidine/putrescine transport system substrate-binding protein
MQSKASIARELIADMTIFELTDRFPDTVSVLVQSGLPKMQDAEQRRVLGRKLTVSQAAKLRGLDLDALVARLREAATIADDGLSGEYDVTLGESNELTLHPPGDVRLAGLLPCPVRIPLLEKVRDGARLLWRQQKLKLGSSLVAASAGTAGLNEELSALEDAAGLPDILLSAGFETFFDRRLLARFRGNDTFVDLGWDRLNRDFEGLELRDPARRFTMLSVVPAIFVVNLKQLGDDPCPTRWEHLLDERFAQRLALPVGDFDLFDALLLAVQKQFGDEGLERLARNTATSLHPSQSVGRFAGGAKQPTVSVIPYFFSRMTVSAKALKAVWPQDGAVLSPIFMLVKRSTVSRSRPIADLLLSQEVGELFAKQGLFPSLHPDVENALPGEPAEHPMSFLGWEHLESRDISREIKTVRNIYELTQQAARAEAAPCDS